MSVFAGKGFKTRSSAARAILLAGAILLALLSGCFTPPDPAREATVAALAERMERTITAAAVEEEAGVSEEKATTVIKSTATAAAQEEARSTEAAVDPAAARQTAEVERPVRAEVPFFGVDANQGRVGFVHPAFTLEAQGQEGIANRNDFAGVTAADFVLSSKITWNTQYGDSGCGFVVRSDGNPNLPSQYLILLTRFANGHIGFLTIARGDLVNGADLYPRSEDRRFKADNDTTNQLTVVGRGHLFEIYTNGVLIGTVDPNQPPPAPSVPPLPEKPTDPQQQKTFSALEQGQSQMEAEIRARFSQRQGEFKDVNKEFPRGFVSMVAVTQGGKVTCAFADTWLWLIEP